ncbi:AraC family transcriptional regulator [Pontimicrobium aquaticum]|uniref:AraC family transcriptional regulator n=1 Tax=Pontimicrobium aquaticum TaxID=2565367 RepID=A0A4U0F0L0_9FLAO|nr:AraC family transcriptional regulator [Pontimicrobium aquaticum]TJY37893.1 AraC family transcriptional regulator [Pontimicrobium aquaticum]
MKVLPFQIPKPEYHALIYQEDKELVFYDKFHQHEEIQVSFIAEGEGTLVVGDTINYYKKGDLLAIGSNLPHVFKSDISLNKASEMLTLFFSKDAFGTSFFELEELRDLKPFFKKVNYGFKVSPKSKILETYFLQLAKSSKLQRFIILLEVLKTLSKSRTQPLSSFIYDKKYTDSEGKRMRDVMDFTMQNYHQQISLDDVAQVSSMTKNAFCKYFKKRTNKSYFTFLNELRIENACKLLISEERLLIADIAEKSGFNNISNFNRQFKTIRKMSPSEFRKAKVV